MSNPIRTHNGPIIKRPKYPPEKQKLAYDKAIQKNPLCGLCTKNDQPFTALVKNKETFICTYCKKFGKVLRRVPIFGFHTPCEFFIKKKEVKKNDN